MSNYTNFDLLLYAATEAYCEKWVEEIEATPVTCEITAKERRRFAHVRRKYDTSRCRWMPFKIACVAVLVGMSLAFSACICIPAIRSAIKQVLVDWYEDYIAVDFKDSEDAETLETIVPGSVSIAHKAYVADLPEGYTLVTKVDTNTYYGVNYYHDGERKFMLSQSIRCCEDVWLDSTSKNLDHITIGDSPAVLITDENADVITYIVIWHDGQYEYAIMGQFDDSAKAVELAEKVALD